MTDPRYDLLQGELIEVTDFSSSDWWTGIKQSVVQEDVASAADHHGGRKRVQTQSFAYGVFPANHVKTIMVTPINHNEVLKKGSVVVMQNQSSVSKKPLFPRCSKSGANAGV